MADGMNGALMAPPDARAVLVLESGVTVSLRLKTRERVTAQRTITQGTVETGYKISDGEIDDPRDFTIEGIITGSYLMTTPYNMSAAASEAQSIMAAFDAKEFLSVYTSFIAEPQCRIRRASVEAEPGKNALSVTLELQKVNTVTFQRSRSNSAQAKTSDPAGKGNVKTGKKTAAKVDPKTDKQTADKAEKVWLLPMIFGGSGSNSGTVVGGVAGGING